MDNIQNCDSSSMYHRHKPVDFMKNLDCNLLSYYTMSSDMW
jgi:hypothetical protein